MSHCVANELSNNRRLSDLSSNIFKLDVVDKKIFKIVRDEISKQYSQMSLFTDLETRQKFERVMV